MGALLGGALGTDVVRSEEGDVRDAIQISFFPYRLKMD